MVCIHSLKYVLLILILYLVDLAASKKVLFFIGFGSRSHRFAMQPLAVKLADLGHDVSFLAAVKPEKTDSRILEVNLKEPFAKILQQNVDLGVNSVAERLKGRHNEHLMQGTVWFDVLINAADVFLSNRDFVEFISNAKFDLVVGDFTCKELAVVMAHQMKAKVIYLYTGGALHPLETEIMGLPIESQWLPDFELGSPYWFVPDHVFSFVNTLAWYASYHWYCLPKMDELVEKKVGGNIPPVEKLLQNIDLFLINERFPYTYPRSLPPFAVPVGGMHVRYTDGVLPKEIEEFLDPFEDFVLISFGSIIDVNRLPKLLRQCFFDTIASFANVGFLWKWDGEVPKDIPKNVFTSNWFPQQEILANSKCKGFVTQGGAMSFQQGIYHAVPMIVIPVWWDQPALARSAAHHGVGIHLELSEINQESLQHALHEILFNETYKNQSKIVSQRAKDQPMASVDTAAWWVEYILRHDTTHLKSPSMNLRWWQRRLLDASFLLYTIFLLTIFVVYKAVKCVIGMILKATKRKKRSKSKQF